MPELRRSWMQIFKWPLPSRRPARGPVGAARLSAGRLGWSAPNFSALVIDKGAAASLTRASPALISASQGCCP
eukprot:1241202-Pyramimonas_sp.AAC.1